jgi:aryl-alcohol dehydrogenase-like predicted oxidoreductase
LGRLTEPNEGLASEETTIDERQLGQAGPLVSVLGMGCARLGAFWQKRPGWMGMEAVHAALSEGITFFETADGYARGRSETLLGRGLRGHRSEVVLATKCGLLKTPSAYFNCIVAARSASPHKSTMHALQDAWHSIQAGSSYLPTYIERAVVSSLRRLRTDFLDVFMLHSPPHQVLAVPEIVQRLDHLRRSGMIRMWGVSAADDSAAQTALELDGIGCLELDVSLCTNDAQDAIVSMAFKRGIGVIARRPFTSGVFLPARGLPGGETPLPGKPREDGASTLVAACLQYPLRNPGVTTVLAGMSRPQHVVANVAALAQMHLSNGELERVRSSLCPDR